MIKLLVVDDHKLVRYGIVSLLNSVDDFEVVGEAESGEQAIELASKCEPDVILMDLQMPGIGGFEATKKLLRSQTPAKILIVTVCDNEIFPTRLLEEGAAGYLTKGCGPDEMEFAIRSILAGERYISPDIAQKLALQRFSDDQKRSPLDVLSERELQVMLMISRGEKSKEIARLLNLSPKTINTYRYRIFDKLRIHSDVELAHLAVRCGIMDNLSAHEVNDEG